MSYAPALGPTLGNETENDLAHRHPGEVSDPTAGKFRSLRK